MLDYDTHKQLQTFFKDMNIFYKENSPLYEIDFSWEGFQWICHSDYQRSILVFRRIDRKGEELICVCNFQPMLREDYIIGVPYAGTYSEVFTTDKEEYGGSGFSNGNAIKSKKKPCHELENSITLTIPPMSVMYFRCVKKAAEKTKESDAEDKTVKTDTKIKASVKAKKGEKVRVTVKAKSKKADKASKADDEKTDQPGKASRRISKKTSKKDKDTSDK